MKLLAILFLTTTIYATNTFESAGFLDLAPAKPGIMSGIDTDKKGNIYILHRGDVPVAKFDSR